MKVSSNSHHTAIGKAQLYTVVQLKENVGQYTGQYGFVLGASSEAQFNLKDILVDGAVMVIVV